MRARIFNIMQYESNPITKKDLCFNVDIIESALEHKQINKWAYICHDSDVYTAGDEEKARKKAKSLELTLKDGVSPKSVEGMKQRIMYYSNIKKGNRKPKHWHVVLCCKSAVDTKYVAKWFNVQENYIDVPKGRGAFLDCVEYLTHEKQTEKQLYNDNLVRSNFDFRKELSERKKTIERFGQDVDPIEKLMSAVMYDGMTLREAQKIDPLGYMKNLQKFKLYRLDYLENRAVLPKLRVNYYVYGESKVGKSSFCRALARELFPEIVEEKDLYFEVGASNTSFDGYDGQPVIIWNDARHWEVLRALKDRGNAFNVFDLIPTDKVQNVKYSHARLINKVNIVNSPDNYVTFLDGLALQTMDKSGEWKPEADKGQSYRRFPFVVQLLRDEYILRINRGVWNDDKDEIFDYDKFTLNGNFGKATRLIETNGLSAKSRELMHPMLAFISDKYSEFCSHYTDGVESEKDVLTYLQGYGKIKDEGKNNRVEDLFYDDEIPF